VIAMMARRIAFRARLTAAMAAVIAPLMTMPVSAGDAGVLSIELNRLEQAGSACRVTFVAGNALGADLEGMSLEIVIFDDKGLVRRMTLFDFGALPAGRQRVRQFELSDTRCETVTRVLVNGVADCTGANLDKGTCSEALRLTNKTETEFAG